MEKAKLCNVIKMEDAKLPRESTFSKHGNVWHTGGGWDGNHGLCYHLYLFLKDVSLKDAVAIAYGDSIECDVQSKPEVLLCIVDPVCRSDGRESAHDNASRSTITVEMTIEGDRSWSIHI